MPAAQPQVIALVVVALLAIAAFFVIGQHISLYIQALVSNAQISIFTLIGMRLRKVDLRTIVYSNIRARKSGLDVRVDHMETHYLAGGRVPNVISAMIASRTGGFPITWDQAAAHDLAGHDILAVAHAMAKAKAHGRPLSFRAACDLDRMSGNVIAAVDSRLASEGLLSTQSPEEAHYRQTELEPWLNPRSSGPGKP